jgi:RNA polymerase sigma factor (sigma-70 family)
VGAKFDTTRWSVVLKAGAGDEAQSRAALATLCEIYWPAVFAFVRRRGHDPDTARDLTQGFFAAILERGGIAEARRERGRFRSFLLGSVKNFLADEHDHRTAQKRGGGHAALSIDDASWDAERAGFEMATPLTPEAIFERRWALALLESTMRDLADEMERARAGTRFAALQPYLVGDADPPYRELAPGLGMNEGAVRVALHRMRQRYGEKLREQVAQTVDDPATIEDEIRHLIGALGA